ncbi:MAG: MOSC domain-containing protein [Chloroflexi bacterium]|nr:MOSC domain-containing protein [Chloroflexota bacterium]
MTAKIIAVCSSRKKGTRKTPISEGLIDEKYGGLQGDAHADCNTHRQVSLLAKESIEKMRKLGLNVGPGDFAENLTTDGIDLVSLPPGTWLSAGKNVILEVTQIGKVCHTRCAIYRQVGQCIMPGEGVFARVIHGGVVRPGDIIQTLDQTLDGQQDHKGSSPNPGM